MPIKYFGTCILKTCIIKPFSSPKLSNLQLTKCSIECVVMTNFTVLCTQSFQFCHNFACSVLLCNDFIYIHFFFFKTVCMYVFNVSVLPSWRIKIYIYISLYLLKNNIHHSRSSCIIFYVIETRCSAIAERPRCRVRYSYGQKWKTGTGRQYLTDIIGLSSTTVI